MACHASARGALRLRVTWAIAVLSAVTFAACVRTTWFAQPWALFGTPFRPWEFGLGALVYLLVMWFPDSVPKRVLVLRRPASMEGVVRHEEEAFFG